MASQTDCASASSARHGTEVLDCLLTHPKPWPRFPFPEEDQDANV